MVHVTAHPYFNEVEAAFEVPWRLARKPSLSRAPLHREQSRKAARALPRNQPVPIFLGSEELTMKITSGVSRGARWTGLCFGALMMAGASVWAADPPETATVLGKLHESNQREIAAGKLAEKSGKSKEVKDFGKMLQKDHTAADKKVTTLAKSEKIDLPAATPAGMNDMSGMANDPMFDSRFAKDMVEDHKKDIAEVTEAHDQTADPKLKKLLGDILPVLHKHEETAQKIVDAQAQK